MCVEQSSTKIGRRRNDNTGIVHYDIIVSIQRYNDGVLTYKSSHTKHSMAELK